jgi:hypothetical protein
MNVSPTNIMSYIIHCVYIFVTLVPSWLTYTKYQPKHQRVYYSFVIKTNIMTYIIPMQTHMSKEYSEICVSYGYIVTGHGKHDSYVTT